MKCRLAFLSTLTAFSVAAFAQSSSVSTATTTTNENRTSLSDLTANKKFEENNDITDAKIKADAGSLSRYSLKFNLSYYGPTLGELDAKDQPNPDGGVGTYDTSLGGSLGGRLRLDRQTTISFGTGLKIIHPLHGAERTDLNNPYASYDLTTKLGGVQMRNSWGVSYITIPNYTAVGEYGGLSYDLSLNYDLGASGFAISFDSSVGYYLYKREYIASDKKASRSSLSFYPGLKYNFTDKLNVNTSTSISYLNLRSTSNELQMINRTVSQRLGLGYAYTRDVYVAPYLNMYPDHLAWDTTTINISTSFSVL